MASLVWGSYGRLIANPKVAMVVSVVVLAINIGLILGSKMWEVPLETEISKLWIDPNSEVSQNNALAAEFGPKVDSALIELFTLGFKNSANMASEDGFTRWEEYFSAIYDTVITYKGNAYTILDICNSRLGQTSYVLGCDIINPLDYFKEGGKYPPTDAMAQWLLDTKIAYNPTKTWEWAMTADSLSRGSSVGYTAWFTGECLESKKVFCGGQTQNSAMIGQVNQLIQHPFFPTAGKLQLAWAKAQMVLAGMLGSTLLGSGTGLDGFGTCTGSAADAQTVSSTATNVFNFTSLGLANVQLDLSKCSITSTGQSCAPGPDSCDLTTLAQSKLLNVSSPCAPCIMATMWWLGDMNRIDASVEAPTSSPTSGLLVFFSIHNEAYASALAETAATQACNPLVQANQVLSNVAPSDCVALWDGFATGTLAALTGTPAGMGTFLQTVTDRAAIAEQYGDARVELNKYVPLPMIESQWRKVLTDGLVDQVNSQLLRHDSRPSYKDPAVDIPVVLSGFKNDLITQNLRKAIFGSAKPAVEEITPGKCECNTGYGGATCALEENLICDCDSNLKSSCITGLVDSCIDLAPCAGYTEITVMAASQPHLAGDYVNFDKEMAVIAGFQNKSTVAGNLLAASCGTFLPCVDGSYATGEFAATMDGSPLLDMLDDAAYNMAFFDDQTVPLSGSKPMYSRAKLLSLGCIQNPLDCVPHLGTFTPEMSSVNITAYFEGLGALLNTQNPAYAIMIGAGDATDMINDLDAKCPSLALVNVGPLTHFAFWNCFMLYTNQQVYPSLRSALAQNLWPIGQSPIKATVCGIVSQAYTAGEPGNCTAALPPFVISALSTAAVALVPPPTDAPTTSPTASPSPAPTTSPSNVPTASPSEAPTASPTEFAPTASPTESPTGAPTAAPIPVISGILQGVFGAGVGAMPPDATQQAIIAQALGKTLGQPVPLFDTFRQDLALAVWGDASATYNNNQELKSQIDNILAQSCIVSRMEFEPSYIEESDCLTLFDNLIGALILQQPSSLAVIAAALAKYRFVGTVAGACGADGVVKGGGVCWEDSDCNQGTCNLGNKVAFQTIEKLAGIIFTNSPEGTLALMTKEESKYRQLANAPILARYAAKTGETDFGELGPVTGLTRDDANEIIRAWRYKYLDNVDAFKTAQASTMDPDALSSDSPSNLLAEISSANPAILLLGYGLMLLYALLACTNWSTDSVAMLNSSRALVAMAGVILVAISVASGLGVSHLANIGWSAVATQIVPFVMLGLGVSDVFIMIRTFPTYRDGQSAADAAAKGLVTAGPSLLIVSVTNAGVFACGILTAMPVVVNFAKQAVIIAVANYLTVNTVLPALLIFDYNRQQRGKADLIPCKTVGTAASKDADDVDKNVFNRTCVPVYSNIILSIPGKLAVLAITVAFMGAAIYGVTNVAELGLQLADIAPADSSLASALETRDTHFPFYTVSIATSEADWSKREVQQGIVDVFADVMDTSKIISGSGTPWMQAFMAWGLPDVPGYDLYAEGQICHPGFARTAGNCGHKFGCTVVTADPSVIQDGKIPFYPEADFYNCLNLWIRNDLYFEALKPGFQLVDPDAPRASRTIKFSSDNSTGKYIAFTRGTVIATGLTSNADYVTLLNEVRAVANKDTTPPTFATGEPFNFWDQYIGLTDIINSAIGYGLLICFAAIFVLLFGLANGEGSGIGKRFIAVLWASIIITGIIALTVYDIYGFMTFAGLRISAIPAISIIMSTGVAVEYTAYIAVAFVNAAGDRNERARAALMLMLAPTIDGAISMLLGVIMLSASPFVFVVKYFFYPWLFIVFFGFFNGAVFLPVLFSLIGPMAINMASNSAAVTDLANKA